MNNKKRIGGVAEIMWVMGIVLCALGVCLSANSGFGVSMLAAPAFVLYNRLKDILPWLTYGAMDYAVQGIVVITTAIICRKFKWKYLMAIAIAMVYGLILDMWRLVFGAEVYGTIGLRIAAFAGGSLIITLAIAMILRTYMPQQSFELIVKETSEKFNIKLSKVKWTVDISVFFLAIVMMLVLFGEFRPELIGIGTLIITFINTPLIIMWGKVLDSFFEFSPGLPKFKEFFEKHFD